MKINWPIIAIFLAAFAQILTTRVMWVGNPTDKQLTSIISRPGLYPLLGYRLESSHLAIGYSNWRRNVWENLNLNQYFFGGHPVERDVDFSKFPFWLLPFALIGIFSGVRKKWFRKMSLITFMFILVFGFVGNHNPYGPIVIYPFWLVSIFLGIKYAFKK